MSQIELDPHDVGHMHWSDPALVAAARRGDDAGIAELVSRHALAMTRFEATVGMAVTTEPGQWIGRLLADDHLPLRAAWLAERASDFVHDHDDAFLLARYTELTTAWRTALWHAEVEGDSPAAIGRLLGIDPDEATLTVRTARNRLLWSIVAATPTGGSQECLDMASQLCGAGADVREVLAVASTHGRTCDECMLLVKRALLFASSLRESLLRSVAGELAGAYSAARPPAFRPRARGDLGAVIVRHGRPAAVTFAMAGAAAAAVAALSLAPGAVSPYLSPERDISASVVQGQLILPLTETAEQTPSTAREPFFPAGDPSSATPRDPDTAGGKSGSGKTEEQGSSSGAPGGDETTAPPSGAPVGEEPSIPTPGAPTTPAPPDPVESNDGDKDGDKPSTGQQDNSPVPAVEVSVGPITVDTGGDAPLVTVDGPVPVEVPALPQLGNQVGGLTETAGGVVSGLLG